MKKVICYCVFCLCMGINTFSQEMTKLSHYAPIKNGKIMLKDGTTMKFKHLKLNESILNYTDLNGNAIQRNISDVDKIAKRSSYAGYGAAAGGAFTLALFISNEISESHYQPGDGNTEVAHSEFIEFGILFAGMGALLGSFFKKYKALYEDKIPISFSPTFMSTPDGSKYAMFSLRYNFK